MTPQEAYDKLKEIRPDAEWFRALNRVSGTDENLAVSHYEVQAGGYYGDSKVSFEDAFENAMDYPVLVANQGRE